MTSSRMQEERVAATMCEGIHHTLDLLDRQAAAVLEIMTAHARQRTGTVKHRQKVRAAIIEYLEERRIEADARERRLGQAITGGDLPDDKR